MVHLVASQLPGQYLIKGHGPVAHQTSAVFIEHSSNGKEHSYALVSGTMPLGLDSEGVLQVIPSSTLDIIYAGGVLWLFVDKRQRKNSCDLLCAGDEFELHGRKFRVATIQPQEQKRYNLGKSEPLNLCNLSLNN